jgi:hypothetical protein
MPRKLLVLDKLEISYPHGLESVRIDLEWARQYRALIQYAELFRERDKNQISGKF